MKSENEFQPRVVENLLGLYVKEGDVGGSIDVKGIVNVGLRTKHGSPLSTARKFM